MKRVLLLALALITIICIFSSCGKTEDPFAGDNENKKQILKVGMECNYAPYNWSQDTDANGALPIKNVNGMYANGYDVQVASAIAKSLDMDIEIYSYEWDSLVPAVEAGTLDLIIAGMSPTEDRKEIIDFSEIYYTSNLVIITKVDSLKNVKTIEDLADKKIAAQSGTSHLDALTKQTKAKVSELSDFSTMFIALEAGNIDGYVAEEPTAMERCGEGSGYSYIPFVNNDTGFKVPIEDTSIAVGVKKGSDLLALINDYLATFDENAQKDLMQQMVYLAPDE